MRTTALIAEDEPLLRLELARHLSELWPELEIVAQAANGPEALAMIREHRPEIAFLDIRMPGATGLEVAQAVAEDAERDDDPVPLIVFVTAYGEFALDAFESSAFDYLLKPVNGERLGKTLARLRQRLALNPPRLDAPPASGAPGDGTDSGSPTATAEQLARQLVAMAERLRAAGAPLLRHLRIGSGNTVRLVPVEEVLYFQAADKYVVVMTAAGEGLIRESLRELQPRLDPARFQQIHRSTIVNLDHVDRAERDELGRVRLHLRGHKTALPVSRLYASEFRSM